MIVNYEDEGITVEKNGEKLDDLAEVVGGDTLSVNISPRSFDEDVFICAAGYQDGILKAIKQSLVSAAEFTSNGASTDVEIPCAIDKFKVFIWDTNNKPILEALTIGG